MGKYVRNNCHLAANFGTKACNFCCRGLIWHKWVILLGGYYAYFSCQTLFFSVIEIFSVTKLRRFLTCRGEVSDYICSNDVLNLIWNYNLICFEFCFVFSPTLFLFRVGGCYAVYCWFWLAFLDVAIYLWCLVSRGIWWGIFKLIFVPPAGYLNPFAHSLSAGVSFQSGLL